jgi:hypothetical protein
MTTSSWGGGEAVMGAFDDELDHINLRRSTSEKSHTGHSMQNDNVSGVSERKLVSDNLSFNLSAEISFSKVALEPPLCVASSPAHIVAKKPTALLLNSSGGEFDPLQLLPKSANDRTKRSHSQSDDKKSRKVAGFDGNNNENQSTSLSRFTPQLAVLKPMRPTRLNPSFRHSVKIK